MKELEIYISHIIIHNPSEKHEWELDLELVFDNLTSLGRIKLPRLTGQKIVYISPYPDEAFSPGPYYPRVRNNKFSVAFHAIERDGPQWIDPDDRAHGRITIDLDTNGGPPSNWNIIASAEGTDLKIEIAFELRYLRYVTDPDIRAPQSPYPWNDATVFEHWLGLGRHGTLIARPEKLYRTWLLYDIQQKRTHKQHIYRFDRADWNLPEDSISSVYVRNRALTLYEHHYSDSRFAEGKRVSLRNPGLYNLSEMSEGAGWNWNDRVSAIEMVVTEDTSNPVN